MSHPFLPLFMHFAQDVTQAQRALCADYSLNMIDQINLDDALRKELDFNQMMARFVQEARTREGYLLTNNAVTDLDDAPTTNTSYAELRTIVVFPIAEHGFVYVDHPVNSGVISRLVIERLAKTLDTLLKAGDLSAHTTASVRAVYDQME